MGLGAKRAKHQANEGSMADRAKAGTYDANNLAAVILHFGKSGDDAAALELLAQGADPNAADRYGFAALHRAAQFDRAELFRALLNAGANVNYVGKSGGTPLMSARSAVVARMLLEAGAEPNASKIPSGHDLRAGGTALMAAARRGDAETVSLLLEYGADAELRNADGHTALMLAGWNGPNATTQRLIASGANVRLTEAALLGDTALTKALLDAGADLNLEETANALRYAAVSGQTETLALLLDCKAPIDATNENGKTALMEAARYGRLPATRLLLERGANPNLVDNGGGTALMDSVGSSVRRNRESVELLLAYGAKANVQSRRGYTPLILCCLWGHIEAIEMLLRHGADPDLFTDAEIMAWEEGCTNSNALIMAVGNGHIEAVKLLLHYGADPLAKNSGEHDALDAARRQNGHKREERQAILPLLEAAAQERGREI